MQKQWTLPAARIDWSFIFHIHNTLWVSLTVIEWTRTSQVKAKIWLLELSEMLICCLSERSEAHKAYSILDPEWATCQGAGTQPSPIYTYWCKTIMESCNQCMWIPSVAIPFTFQAWIAEQQSDLSILLKHSVNMQNAYTYYFNFANKGHSMFKALIHRAKLQMETQLVYVWWTNGILSDSSMTPMTSS